MYESVTAFEYGFEVIESILILRENLIFWVSIAPTKNFSTLRQQPKGLLQQQS